MVFPITPQYEAAILRQYEGNISRYPLIKEEVELFLRDKEGTFSLCLKYLYGHMAAQDVLSFSPEDFAGYVRATLQALAQIGYLQAVPPEIFFPYVLHHRVNSECLDDSRSFLLTELLPHVLGKTMEQAALAVNYWCYAHATYTPADDRTLGPMAVLRRTLGRCGEESVLAVAALRSVGIPARQCYCPRWSHCDDNHAWVEVWTDGQWHYLGACEPEPVLDRGWFTAAASRAMLVDTKCWAHWQTDALYQPVNCISRYTHSKTLTVQVTHRGQPVAGAQVRFQIINYSQLFTLWEATTGQDGIARFLTGPGDLLVYAQWGHQVALEKIDLRQQTSLNLELQDSFPPQLTVDLVPPEDSSGAVPFADTPRHRERLHACEAHLAARRGSFARTTGYCALAALNAPEVQRFLEDTRYPESLKKALLDTLRPKDFVDITKETLVDALESAIPARGQYPGDIFRSYILAPRVADEMLLPERQRIRQLFPHGFAGPQEILAWMQTHMECLPDGGIRSYYPSAYGCLRCRQVPAFAFHMVFVSLCRVFCFPARLEPSTGCAQWLDPAGTWRGIHPTKPPVALKLLLPQGQKLHYFEHITLGLWDGSDFVTLQYPDLTLEGCHTFQVQPGYYRITVTTRQIDGTASSALWHLHLSESRTLTVLPPADQTSQRLKQQPLVIPEGPLKTALAAGHQENLLLIFADPGSEPTEHLLLEMVDLSEDFRGLPCRILLLTDRPDALDHPTVQLLQAALPKMEVSCLRDPDALEALHRQMQVGDLRLPFVVCADGQGLGVYADANYRIRLAQTLLEIQKLLRLPPGSCRQEISGGSSLCRLRS